MLGYAGSVVVAGQASHDPELCSGTMGVGPHRPRRIGDNGWFPVSPRRGEPPQAGRPASTQAGEATGRRRERSDRPSAASHASG